MARRYDHSKDEIMKMAVEAGKIIIQAEGFSALSARRVAKEIGYAVGTIANVFGSHDNFILHVNAKTLDDMYEYIFKKLARKNDEGNIKKLSDLYIKFAEENYNRWSALFEFSLPSGVELPEWYEEKISKLFLLVEDCLMPIFKNQKKAEEHARILWASIHGICQLGLTGKLDAVKANSVKKMTNVLIENYLTGALHEK